MWVTGSSGQMLRSQFTVKTAAVTRARLYISGMGTCAPIRLPLSCTYK